MNPLAAHDLAQDSSILLTWRMIAPALHALHWGELWSLKCSQLEEYEWAQSAASTLDNGGNRFMSMNLTDPAGFQMDNQNHEQHRLERGRAHKLRVQKTVTAYLMLNMCYCLCAGDARSVFNGLHVPQNLRAIHMSKVAMNWPPTSEILALCSAQFNRDQSLTRNVYDDFLRGDLAMAKYEDDHKTALVSNFSQIVDQLGSLVENAERERRRRQQSAEGPVPGPGVVRHDQGRHVHLHFG